MTGKRGRPSTGVAVHVRIPADVLAVIDDDARERDLSRAEVIRNLLRYAILVGDAIQRHCGGPRCIEGECEVCRMFDRTGDPK